MGFLRSKQKPRVAQRLSLPAPVGGLNAIDPLQAMSATDAVVLDNFYPKENSIVMRNGFKIYFDDFSDDVKTLFAYQGANNELFCSCDDGKIYKINKDTPATKNEVKSGLFNSNWEYINFGTPDNRFLVAVNGIDKMQLYNGSAWSDANITGLKVGEEADGASFRDIVSHKSRIWVIRDAFTAGYLSVQSVQGEIADFELGSLFSKGGKLLKLFTFSITNINNGSDDYLAFLSTEGEVVVYQGTDPTSSSTWSIVGVYKLALPIGKRCVTSFNGDALILTTQGVFSVQALVGGAMANQPARKINPLIVNFFNLYGKTVDSSIFYVPEKNRLYVNLLDNDNKSVQLVMNASTGAWCRYTGMPVFTQAVQNNIIYACHKTTLYLFDYGIKDNEEFIKAKAICAFSNYGTAEKKYITHLKPFVFSKATKKPKYFIETATDFSMPVMNNDVTAIWQGMSTWDLDLWDSAVWSTGEQILNDWLLSAGLGVYIAPAFAVYGNFNEFTWSAIDIQYQISGGV